jgi:MYXO-CTERM domain-containing protein
MNLRHLLTLACTLSLGISSASWALPVDAGSTDTAEVPADVTAIADDTTSSDTASSDATDSADTTTTTPGIDPCWTAKCPKEVAACTGDKDCAYILYCNALPIDQAKADPKCTAQPSKAASDLLNAMDACGWKSCVDKTGGSCATKCGIFVSADKCHCDDACLNPQYDDCCADRATICGAGTASCAKSDCSDGSAGTYADGSDSSQSNSKCGCDAACDTNQDCCDDYATTCKGKTPTCVPACTNKDNSAKTCGPDGCGGSCGTCKSGEKCVSGGCTGTATGTDAGSTADTTGSVDDTTAADTGATTGGGSTPKSSGCTASTTGNGSAGWASALFGLGLIVAMRRRRA